MTKFLYLQDTHISGITPSNRLGDYYSDIMNKVAQVIALATLHKVDFIVHGGDLFNSDLVSNTIVDDFIDLIEQTKITWYILPGNHDEKNHSWDLSKASSLNHMFRRSVYIKELTTLDTSDIIIQGFKYFHNIEQDIKDNGININSKKYKAAVVHAMITPKDFPKDVSYVRAEKIKTNCDLVLVAHYHKAYKVNNIVNIGCLGRTKIDERDIKPQVAIVTKEEISLFTLDTKGEETFNLEKLYTGEISEQNVNDFVAGLDIQKLETLDINGMIEYLAKEQNIEKSVVNYILTKIGEVNE